MANIDKSYCEWVLDKYPKTCEECPFFQTKPYRDNGYQGHYALCDLGYMKTGDTREFSGHEIRWPRCDIENYPYVYVEDRNGDENRGIMMGKLSCGDCIHRLVCNNKEEYAIFLDETMKEAFDLMPDFLDMRISCKYFREDYPTPRNTSAYIPKELVK